MNAIDWFDWIEDGTVALGTLDLDTINDFRAELIDKAERRGAMSNEIAATLRQHFGLPL